MTSITFLSSFDQASSNFPESYKNINPDKCYETAEKFTAVFLTQIVSEMFKTQDERLGGIGEEIFESFLAEKIADQMVLSSSGQEMTALINHQMILLQENNKMPLNSDLHTLQRQDLKNTQSLTIQEGENKIL